MLIRKSAPQPEIMKTPTGGTIEELVLGEGERERKRGFRELTEYSDDDD